MSAFAPSVLPDAGDGNDPACRLSGLQVLSEPFGFLLVVKVYAHYNVEVGAFGDVPPGHQHDGCSGRSSTEFDDIDILSSIDTAVFC